MSVELIFELAWKSLLVAGAAVLILPLMRRRSAAERSWVAHIGLLTTLLLPLTVIAGPNWQVAALEPVATLASGTSEREAEAPRAAQNSKPAAAVQLSV